MLVAMKATKDTKLGLAADRYLSIPKTRQRLRTGLMLAWVILMPVSLYYFSPYLPFMGLAGGLIVGSIFVFAGQFATSLLFGRLFCAWLCPAGAVQDFSFIARPRRVARRSLQWVKFGLWAPWIAAWIALALSAAGVRTDGLRPDFFFQLQDGISVSRPEAYVIYLSVLTLILGISLILGRRGFCHTACWMAPFMILGQKLGSILHLPGIHLKSDSARCTSCGTCSVACPMSLDVGALAKSRQPDTAAAPIIRISHHDCIYCLRCVDVCPSAALKVGFGARS
jgi:ferredoxin-type protein NapH